MAEESREQRRRFGKGRRDQAREKPVQRLPEKVPELKPGTCHLCGKQIFDMSSALADRDNPEPVHFDCALQRISEFETLAPGEKILYIGKGSFAVVEFAEGSQTAFTIKRKVPWEKENQKYDWRKSISQRLGL